MGCRPSKKGLCSTSSAALRWPRGICHSCDQSRMTPSMFHVFCAQLSNLLRRGLTFTCPPENRKRLLNRFFSWVESCQSVYILENAAELQETPPAGRLGTSAQLIGYQEPRKASFMSTHVNTKTFFRSLLAKRMAKTGKKPYPTGSLEDRDCSATMGFHQESQKNPNMCHAPERHRGSERFSPVSHSRSLSLALSLSLCPYLRTLK